MIICNGFIASEFNIIKNVLQFFSSFSFRKSNLLIFLKYRYRTILTSYVPESSSHYFQTIWYGTLYYFNLMVVMEGGGFSHQGHLSLYLCITAWKDRKKRKGEARKNWSYSRTNRNEVGMHSELGKLNHIQKPNVWLFGNSPLELQTVAHGMLYIETFPLSVENCTKALYIIWATIIEYLLYCII